MCKTPILSGEGYRIPIWHNYWPLHDISKQSAMTLTYFIRSQVAGHCDVYFYG